ncbi:insulinase family protein [Microbacterium sp. 2FI]|uniref:M16 family metallopeptidase n=1 Tax=Microbacterium sp. 2FI TaxID=2502193 RepID=UPI0010F50FF6|nr:insulinase family protein [Microbacterium sp. 2FI]
MSLGADAGTGSGVVNGVPVLFAHRPGPVSGGLLFRVGWSDEPLARAGITHLVEHLALHGRHDVSGHHNASTGESITHFHATGTEAEVVAALSGTCAALREMPLGRMEVEKEILRTEAAGRSFGALDRHRLERYGARGPGLAGFAGFGLSAITVDDVRDWVSEWFVIGNAVMWITGAGVPPDLDLRLPPGPRRPVPVWTDLLISTPAFCRGNPGGVLLDAVVPRSAAASLFAKVASRALFRVLRDEGGYSYAAQCEYEPIGADSARVTMYADALEDAQAAVVGGMVDVLAALRGGAVDANDLLASKEAARLALDDPFIDAAMLPGIAMNELIGGERRDAAELQREGDAVTIADLTAVAQAVWDDALIQIPEGALDWAGFAALPTCSTAEITGRSFPRLDQADAELVIGDDGVMMRSADGRTTVRFEDCVALESWPDGARTLIGCDGFVVHIEPTLHEDLDLETIASVDAGVAPTNHLPRPARPPEQIPQRPPAPSGASGPTRRRGWRWWESSRIAPPRSREE